MTQGQIKLERHRARALKGGSSPTEYARALGLSPQRVGRLLKEGAAVPTLPEAVALQSHCKIKPADWIE